MHATCPLKFVWSSPTDHLSDNDVLWRRHNVGGCTHSWGVYMVPHCFICIRVPLSPLLALLLLRWRLHLTIVYAQFTALFLWSIAPNRPTVFLSQCCINSYEEGTKHNKRQKQNRLPKRLMLAKKERRYKLYIDSIKLNQPNSELLGEITVKKKG